MSQPAPSPLRILVVDDDHVNRLVLDDLLGLLGHRPTSAASGEEALAALAAAEYDLVLTDVHMPIMTGVELLMAIRERGMELPVVAVTADLMSRTPKQYREDGFAAVVTKPLDPESLKAALRT